MHPLGNLKSNLIVRPRPKGVECHFVKQLIVPSQHVELLARLPNSHEHLIWLDPLKNIDESSLFSKVFHFNHLLHLQLLKPSEIREHSDKLVVIPPPDPILLFPCLHIVHLLRRL